MRVYGSLGPNDPPFSETTAYAPNSPYAASKAASDHLVRAYHHTYGLPTLTTNCSNNYGPFQFPEKLMPLLILNAQQGKPLPVYGDGKNVRDWLYVEDHCEAAIHIGVGGGKDNPVGAAFFDKLANLRGVTNVQITRSSAHQLGACPLPYESFAEQPGGANDHYSHERSRQLIEKLGIAKKDTTLIFRRNDWFAMQFPSDVEIGIVPGNRALALRSVVSARFIEYVRGFGENNEAVRATCGNPQHALVFSG